MLKKKKRKKKHDEKAGDANLLRCAKLMPHLLPGQEVEDAEWEDLLRHHRLPRTPQHAPRLSLRRHRIRKKK